MTLERKKKDLMNSLHEDNKPVLLFFYVYEEQLVD